MFMASRRRMTRDEYEEEELYGRGLRGVLLRMLRRKHDDDDTSTTKSQKKKRASKGTWLGDFGRWLLYLLLFSGSLAGGVLYLLQTHFDEVLRTHVESRLRLGYPDLHVNVQRARRLEGQGLELRDILVSSGPGNSLVHIDELLVECNAALTDILAGNIQPRRIVVRGLQSQFVRHADGSNNLEKLFPIPRLSPNCPPVPIVIETGTVDLLWDENDTGPPRTVSLRQISLTPEPPSITGPTVDTPSSWYAEGIVSSRLCDEMRFSGRYDAARKEWQAVSETTALTVSPELVDLLPNEHRQYADALQALRGTASVALQMGSTSATNGIIQVNAQGAFRGSLNHANLPFPVTDVTAEFVSDGKSLNIPKFSARVNDAVLSGECNIMGFREDAPCHIRLRADRLHIDRRVVMSLPTQWSDLWSKLSPEGLVNAEITLDFDGREARHHAVVTCQDVAFAYHRFPYRLTGGTGTVELHNGFLTFQDFRAFAKDRKSVV